MSLIIETDEEEEDKKTSGHSVTRQKKDEAVTSTTSISGEYPERSQSKETSTIIGHANADQINSVSEVVLNLLKGRIPVHASTYGKLKRHKKVLRELGKRRNSVRRRRKHLIKQKGGGFWSGLNDCFRACCVR